MNKKHLFLDEDIGYLLIFNFPELSFLSFPNSLGHVFRQSSPIIAVTPFSATFRPASVGASRLGHGQEGLDRN